MINSSMTHLQRATVSVAVACALPLLAHPVSAADQAGPVTLEEIVVTAEKRAGSLQDTALSISAFTGSMMDDRGVLSAGELAKFVPNMTIGDFGGSVVLNLRGIQTNDTTETGDPSVAFHVDGVYQARPRGAGAQFYDLERVEVLRGPQGTLYGRNATAGSLNVITRKPEEDFSASLELIAGNYDRLGVRGMLNLPVLEDTLSLRLAYYSEERDGYGKNDDVDPSIEDTNDDDTQSFRLHGLYTPTENLSILLSGYYFETDAVGSHWIDLNAADKDDLNRFPLNSQPYYDADQTRIAMDISWDLGDWVLNYLPSYQEDAVNEQLRDMDGTNTLGILPPFVPPFSTFGPFTSESEQESHELRLAWDGDSSLTGQVGLYYFEEEQETVLDVILFANFLEITFDQYDAKAESKAIFTDIQYDFNETWQITGGLRYTDDYKHRYGEQRSLNLAGAPIAPPGMSSSPNAGKVESDSTDWKLGVNWTPSDGTLYYALAGTGYKQGGFNGGVDLVGYEPEELMNFEVGAKLELWDSRARMNFSAFLMDYTDLQVSAVSASADDVGLVTKNAAESTIWGMELEGLVLATDAFEIDYALSYLSAEYDEFVTCGDPLTVGCSEIVDLEGNNLTHSPEWTVNLGFQYLWSLGNAGSLTSRLQFTYVDEYYIREYNSDLDKQDGYHKTDLIMTYRTPSQNFLVEAFVKNIEDEEVVNNGLNMFTYLAATVSPPRTYGIRAAYYWD